MSEKPAGKIEKPVGTGIMARAHAKFEESTRSKGAEIPKEKPTNGKAGHTKPTEKSPWPEPIPASALDVEAEEIDWLWHGCIARGHLTLFSALMKAGKTTVIGHLLKSMQTGALFCGRETAKCKTLIVSEESKTIWRNRRDNLALDDSLYLLCKPMVAKPSQNSWFEFIQYVKTCAEQLQVDLVIFDTIATFAPWKSENDSAEVIAALNPLTLLTEAGFGVVLIHHIGKNDSDGGRAARGSTALGGAVDIMLELRRFKPKEITDRRRVLNGLGRFEEIPCELVIELNDDGTTYTEHGDQKTLAAEELNRAILKLLPSDPPGMTRDETHDALPESNRPGVGEVGKALQAGVGTLWHRDGTGKKGDPNRFWLRSP
jgi:hypothetical protein